MRLTKSKLKQIIKEEIAKIFRESMLPVTAMATTSNREIKGPLDWINDGSEFSASEHEGPFIEYVTADGGRGVITEEEMIDIGADALLNLADEVDLSYKWNGRSVDAETFFYAFGATHAHISDIDPELKSVLVQLYRARE